MRQRALGLLVASILLLLASHASARCLAYEPSNVTLTGRIEMRKLAGPPNYRSVARGDRSETVYFVVLNEAVCVSADPTSRLNQRGHAGVGEVQLVISPVKGSAAVGKSMRIVGTLSNARGAQHRTPVVLAVKQMTPARITR